MPAGSAEVMIAERTARLESGVPRREAAAAAYLGGRAEELTRVTTGRLIC